LNAQIEYLVVSLDEENRNARLSLRQSQILDELRQAELAAPPRKPGSCVDSRPLNR
jgi:glutamate--cysteine ligase catalytic subunit